LKKHPFDYKDGVGPRCTVCGAKKGWRLAPYHYPSRKQCRCDCVIGRDGPYPHEPTHPMCMQNANGQRNQMKKAGVSDEDIAFEIGGEACGTAQPPF
jgi:hypothetical protein